MSNNSLSKLFRTPAAISILHSLFVACVLICLFTGFRLATVAEAIDWLDPIRPLLPQGNMHPWHLFSGGILGCAFICYLGYLFVTKGYRRLALKLTAKNLNEQLFRLSAITGLALLTVSLLTGAMQFFNIYLGSYEIINTLHQVTAILLLVFIVLHLLVAAIARGFFALVKIFLPGKTKAPLLIATLLALTISAILVTTLTPKALQDTLPLVSISEEIRLDGEPSDPVWKSAPKITVMTTNGHNFPDQQVEVSIQAAHDQENAYFLFRWPDSSRSMKHLPLLKTEEGWTVLQNDLARADENQFYEDKFAVMLSRSATFGGAGTTHLGEKPLKNHPKAIGGRGLHYTEDGSITDVWHWKAVRTGFSIGQADDNHFGRPLPSDSEFARYTGGYQKDPDCEHKVRWEDGDYHLKPECGGYISNWKMFKPGILIPRRIPTNPKLVRNYDKLDLGEDVEDYGQWWMKWNETEKYNPDRDTFPVGSVIPSVLSLGPYQLDRAGISASATWRDGVWTLEMKRQLQSDSEYDLPIENGVYFWVAAFNHSQTRHTYHLHPLKLELQ